MIYKSRKKEAFTLVEVVVALGIFIFAGFALIGLLSVGLQNSRDSKEQLQAANIAEFICSTRRATPMTNFPASTGSQPGFPLPVLFPSQNNLAATTPTYLTWDGTTTTTVANARFGLLYNIMAPTTYVTKVTPGVSTVYLCIYWPAQASPTNAATGHFEVTTTFALP